MPERTPNPKQTNKTPLAVRLENQDKLRTLDKKDTPGGSFVLPFILSNFCRKSFLLKKYPIYEPVTNMEKRKTVNVELMFPFP